MKSLVAIVGRPNVGKSTLFNRLAGKRLALVEDVPGVTRDRHYAESDWDGKPFTLIDTGGFVPGETDALLKAVREQAQLAVEEADVILFVVDGRAGLTPADEEVAGYLRRTKKPVILAVNKIDSTKQEESGYFTEFYKLAIEPTLAISAEHSRGVTELMDQVGKHLRVPEKSPLEAEASESFDQLLEEEEEEKPETVEERRARQKAQPIRIAIVGRPNVGKSTFVNAVLREERLVASPVPGTTTDPIDMAIEFRERKVILTDTAGIRRKKNIAQKVEQYSVVAALKAIEQSHVAVVMLDALEPAVDQDERIAGIAEEKGRAMILVVNKWDQVQKAPNSEEEGRAWVKKKFPFAQYAPVIFTSALKGSRVDKVLEAAVELFDQYTFRARTPQLNKLLVGIQESHPAPVAKGRRIRLYYMAQVASEPPTFTIVTSQPEEVPADYKRYLVNEIRNAFNLRVPIRLLFRERPGQAKRASRKRTDLIEKRKQKRRNKQ